MNLALRRGACPTLAAPMQTGDGLLARLNPVAEGLSPQQLVGLCEAALRHGNGVVEVTSRGSFQIRGLTQRSAGGLALEIDGLGIAVRSGAPVETGPIAGFDPDEIADPRPLAERIRRDITVAGLEGRLGPKVSVIVDGGGHVGMDELSADVRVNAVLRGPDVTWHVAAGGNVELAREIGTFTGEDACRATLAILTEIAALGRESRASKLPVEKLRSALVRTGNVPDVAPPSVLPDISPSRGEIGRPLRFRQPSGASDEGRGRRDLPISPLEGEMSGRTEGGDAGREPSRDRQFCQGALLLTDGRFATAIALPFGHTRAETLAELVSTASTLGASEIRLGPRRQLLFLCPSEASARSVHEAATSAGLITDPSDPRARIAACPGAPACASGHIPARVMAAEIAKAMPAGLPVELHVSGCEKRCAKPNGDGLTLLGRPDSAALVLGRRGATPLAHVAKERGTAAIGRVLQLVADQRKHGVPDERRMHQLGKDRLAHEFLGRG
jgi:precorrin-3B synthase